MITKMLTFLVSNTQLMANNISIALCFFVSICTAQDLSGLWVHDEDGLSPEGLMEVYGMMYLKAKDSGQIFGLTYDNHMQSWCSFYLEGEYDSENKELIAKNTEKIVKPLLHVRSRYKLTYEKRGNTEYLIGNARQKGVHGFALSFGGLMRISLKYRKVKREYYQNFKGYEELKPFIDSLKVKFSIETKDNNFVVENPIIEVEETEKTIAITKEKDIRKNRLLRSHTINSNILEFEIFDKYQEDGDLISIYINDILFKFEFEVKNESKFFELNLPPNRKVHRLVFVANNEGSISPNTATIRYRVNNKTYEEDLSTDRYINMYLEFKLPE